MVDTARRESTISLPGVRRALWELGKLRVLDGGADGDAETGPNTLFAVQGVFVP